jgi:hypothetical protein
MWRLAPVLSMLAALLAAAPADASVVFVNLGTAAPPAAVGPFAVTPYDQDAQAAIPNMTNTSVIPGSPIAPDTTTSFRVQKRAVGDGWASWSHGYGGAVFFTVPTEPPLMLTVAPARAFYLYVEPAAFGRPFAFTVTTNAGGASGPVFVDAAGGATGFAFYTTAGESITSITIAADFNAGGFAFAELGLGLYGVGTPSPTATPRPTFADNGGCSLSRAPAPSAWWLGFAALACWGRARLRRRR